MNFNIIFLLAVLFILGSCGVKTKPHAPSGTTLPSIVKQYEQLSIQQKKDNESQKKTK